MRVFNHRTETRDQCSIIHHADENIEIWHSIDEDPRVVLEVNQKTADFTILSDYNQYSRGVTSSTIVAEFYQSSYDELSIDKLRDITQHIKLVATRHIINYGERFSLLAIDSYFLDMLKTELINSVSSLVTDGTVIEEIIVHKLSNPISFSTSLNFIIVFSNFSDRKKMSFTIDTGNL